MNNNQSNKEIWSKAAELYESKFMNLSLYNDSYDEFCKLINQPNAGILEIACGPGNITNYLLNKNPQYKIDAIDYAPGMIELAKRNVSNASFNVMDCRNINKLNKKYEGVVAGFVIPYLDKTECEKLINDCSSLLSPQGVLYLSFIEGDHSSSDWETNSKGERMWVNYYQQEDIIEMLSANSFVMANTFCVECQGKKHKIMLSNQKKVTRNH